VHNYHLHMKLDNLDQDVEGVHALHVHVEYVDNWFPLTPSTVTLT